MTDQAAATPLVNLDMGQIQEQVQASVKTQAAGPPDPQSDVVSDTLEITVRGYRDPATGERVGGVVVAKVLFKPQKVRVAQTFASLTQGALAGALPAADADYLYQYAYLSVAVQKPIPTWFSAICEADEVFVDACYQEVMAHRADYFLGAGHNQQGEGAEVRQRFELSSRTV